MVERPAPRGKGKKVPAAPAPDDPARLDPALEPLAVPIESVTLWESNYRQGDVGAVSESLRRFGQRKPVVVQASSRTVIAGNHVLRAATALGWRRIAAVVADLGDEEATAYAIADNRTSDLAVNDDAQLSALLTRLVADNAGNEAVLVGTGYDADDLEALLKKVARDAAPEAFGDVDESLETSYQCPMCHYEWSGKPRPTAPAVEA